jgi:hypothetical protein
VAAQVTAPSLPEYTNDQRWGRLAYLELSGMVSEIALGKTKGMTVDEIGAWLGEFYTRGWVGGLDARQMATSFRLNNLSHPQARVEMTTFTDTLVVMRSFATDVADFGPDRQNLGVTIDEYRKVFAHVNRIIADHVGVALDQRYDGDWLVLTMRNGYRLPQAAAEQRWARAANSFKLATLDVIRGAKASGKTARDAGAESAKVWAGTWSAVDTPWRLFRSMTWNSMVDPNYVCDLESANATMVRARCNRPWVATVNAQAERTGVSLADYEAYMLASEQGVATAIGMTWEVRMDGDWRVITVRRK